MKKLAITLLTALILAMFSSSAISGEREAIGAIIGAGSGAVIGHAIGGNSESAIIGSALGGIIGVSASRIHDRGIVVTFPPRYDSRGHRHYYGDRHHYRDRYHYRDYDRYSRYNRDQRSCRVVKYFTYDRGHKFMVKERRCRLDRGHGNHYYDRHYNKRIHKDWRDKRRRF